MADASEGLNPATTDTVARQTLGSLRTRLWSLQGLASSYKTIPAPLKLRFLVMDKIEEWHRQDGSNGEATVYALVSREDARTEYVKQ